VGNVLTEVAHSINAIGNALTKAGAVERSTNIRGSLIIFWNPKANGGKARQFAARVYHTLDEMQKKGELTVEGQVVMKPTSEDPDVRIKEMIAEIEAIRSRDPNERIIVVGLGGDRTADDVANAVRQVYALHKSDKIKPYIVAVAGPGGTANDLRRVTGVPSDTRKFVRFLSTAVTTHLHAVQLEAISDSGETKKETTFHGTTWGVSGYLFGKIDQKKREKGSFSVLETIFLLPETILHSRTIRAYVEVNGKAANNGKDIEAAEIFGPTVTPEMGRIGWFPMPSDGSARIMFAPPLPLGIIPFSESIVLGILVALGFQQFVSPDGYFLTLPRERNIDIKRGDVVTMKFHTKDGKPQPLTGTIAGDAHPPVQKITFETLEETVPFLSDPDANIRVQQRLATPSSPRSHLTSTAVTKMTHRSRALANHIANMTTRRSQTLWWSTARTTSLTNNLLRVARP
jgi:diacylglycerol kinase family enzyme